MPNPPIARDAVMTATALRRQPLVSAQVLGRMHLLTLVTRLPRPESEKLRQKPDEETARSEDNKAWCTLKKWLNLAPADKGGILCRRSGLTIRFDRAGIPANVNLLPFDAGAPLQAELRYSDGATAHAHALQAQLDHREKCLNLLLPFEEARAGQDRYEAVVRALSRPPGVRVHFAYGHAWETPVPAARPPRPVPPVRPVPLPRPTPQPLPRPRVRDHRTSAATRVTPGMARILPDVRLARGLDADALRVAAVAVQPQPQGQPQGQPQYQKVAVKREFETPGLIRSLEDETAFPDWLRFNLPGGWDQFAPAENRRLYYKPSSLLDTFLYLPSRFKLGYFLDPEELVAVPPVRVKQYQDGEGRQRFKVTLVAIPHVDDADRESLRRHLKDVVLSGQMPFVRLQQAGGLTAEFASNFTSGSGASQRDLPEGIASKVVLLDIDSRLILEFDMAAERYEIFCQLLIHGLRGSVAVSSEVQNSIPVSLDLTDVITSPVVLATAPEGMADGVLLWQEGDRVTEGDDDEPVVVDSGEEAAIDLVMANGLEHPVRLTSVKAVLLDTGSLPGTIWEAEEIDLVSQGARVLAGRDEGDGHRLTLPISQSTIAFWNETLIQIGQVKVEGGSPTDWLHRVHQDPSLQAAEFALRLEALSTPGDADVQSIRLRILKAGTPDVRQEREIRPADGMIAWPLRMTLDELAGLDGDRARFVLEYDCVFHDGRISLTQRIAVDLEGAPLLLRPLVETPRSTFTVEVSRPARETRESLSREQVEELIGRLVASGGEWRVYAREEARPDPSPEEPRPDPEPGPVDPVESGPEVTLITDLLSQPFESGSLQNVFVVLQADEDGAPQTTLTVSADRPGAQTWRPRGGTIPPFRYKITYLFEGGRARQKAGVEASPVLLLDPSDVE
jgi:hypothetical protein